MRYSRESYFEPKFVSIGPYYEKLKDRNVIRKVKEECISYFASKLQTGTSNLNINDLVLEFNYLVQQIYVPEMKVHIDKWYGKNFGLTEDEFFQIDGEECMFYPGVDLKTIRFDLLLLENQIPLFFLEKVYYFLSNHNLIPPVTPSEYSLSSSNSKSTLSCEQSESQLSQSTLSQEKNQSTIFIDEFLIELKPFIWLDMPWKFDEQAVPTDPKHLLDLYWKWCILSPSEGRSIPLEWPHNYKGSASSWGKIHLRSNAHKRIKNAYELYQRADVNFQKREHKDGFDVTFQHGIMQMPHLHLVAFEDCMPSNKRFLTSYVLLLDELINSEKDVELLERHGVITNTLSSRQMACTYFNDIGNVCLVDYNNHYCQKQFDDLNSYYNSNWNHQFAILWHKYFNSPWVRSHLVVGWCNIACSLSAIQTHYTIASYHLHR
ncbi:UPF0481 protein At3g47200-like [Carex rostrata]